MKKLPVAFAIAAALGSTGALAYTVGQYANGVLVPRAIYSSAADTTVVGFTSCQPGTVFWTFFDVNSNHVTDGQFGMTKFDQASFVWASEAGNGLENKEGYLVFTFSSGTVASVAGGGDGDLDGADVACLAGNAFQVNTANQDVAYVPALPLYVDGPVEGHRATPGQFGNNIDEYGEDFGDDGEDDLTTMDADSIVGLYAGAQDGTACYVANATTAATTCTTLVEDEVVDMRYFVDGATGGTDTTIVVWSVDMGGWSPSTAAVFTVNMYNDAQARKSVNFTLPNREQNTIDPERIVGRPSNFTDGFIKWGLLGTGTDAVFSYSIIDAPAFGAVQTMLNAHYDADID